jgi:hypothetical protein
MLLQDEASPSFSSRHYDFVSLDERSPMILFYEAYEDLFN